MVMVTVVVMVMLAVGVAMRFGPMRMRVRMRVAVAVLGVEAGSDAVVAALASVEGGNHPGPHHLGDHRRSQQGACVVDWRGRSVEHTDTDVAEASRDQTDPWSAQPGQSLDAFGDIGVTAGKRDLDQREVSILTDQSSNAEQLSVVERAAGGCGDQQAAFGGALEAQHR